jgi:protoporphyrinogen oxidase
MQKRIQKVAIIGGGISGLALAYELSQFPQFEITIFEKSPTLGGLAGSVHFEGWDLDIGSHRIHPRAHAEALKLLENLLGDSLVEMPRRGRIRFQDKWISYPPSVMEMALSYRPGPLGRITGSWAAQRLRISERLPSHTFEGALTARFGRRLFNDFYRPYAEKLWGLSPGQISSVAAEQRAQRFSVGRTLSDVFRWATASDSKHTFLYPSEGFGMVTRCLEQRLIGRGVKILKNTCVETLRLDPSGKKATGLNARLMNPNGEGSLFQMDCDWVASTAPLQFNLSLLENSGQEKLHPAPQLRYRHLRLVYLATEDRPLTRGEALYLPGSESRFGRVSFPLRYRKQEKSAVTQVQPVVLEAPCAMEDEIWKMDDASIVALCQKDLVDLGIFEQLRVQASKTVRVPNVYPVYEVGWEKDFQSALAYQARTENFIPVGRSALFLHCNIDHCISMGTALARTLATEENPQQAWSTQQQSFHDFTPHE